MSRCAVKMWLRLILSVALVGLALIVGLHRWSDRGAEAAVISNSDRALAPAFEAEDVNGGRVNWLEFHGRVVVLNFWLTSCEPCLEEIGAFNALEKAYHDKGLVVLGVALDRGGWNTVLPFVKEHVPPIHLVIPRHDIADDFGGFGKLPVTVILDREGRIASTLYGPAMRSTYETAILSVLTEYPVSRKGSDEQR